LQRFTAPRVATGACRTLAGAEGAETDQLNALAFNDCLMSRPDTDVRCWAKLKCPVLPLVLTVCVPWFQYNAALKGSLEPALRVSPFS
jgi:hypothetical protein